jgi:hypothetical protein
MTKAELLNVLRDVPDDARVSVCGAGFDACVYDSRDNVVTFDDTLKPFLDGGRLNPRYKSLIPLPECVEAA